MASNVRPVSAMVRVLHWKTLDKHMKSTCLYSLFRLSCWLAQVFCNVRAAPPEGKTAGRRAQVGTVPPEHMNWTPLFRSLPLTMLSEQKYGNSTPR